jgi:hypothetical protein
MVVFPSDGEELDFCEDAINRYYGDNYDPNKKTDR